MALPSRVDAPRRSAAAVERVEDVEGFRRLRPAWEDLLASSPSDSLFLTWEWLFTWWKHLAGSRRLSILAVRSEGRLIAIAPLAVRPPELTRLSPFQAMEFLGTGCVGSDYLDVILRAGQQQPAIAALADHLARGRTMLELAQIRRAGAAAFDLAGGIRERGWSASQAETAVCPFIDLTGLTWERYLASLGPAHRANFQRRFRALSRSGLIFEQAHDEEQRRGFLSQLIDLHQLRWERRGGSEAFQAKSLIAFHEEFSALALRRGWLRLFLLRLDGKPVAALYGFRYHRTFYFYQSGFDPEHAKQSVGLVAMGLTIRKAVEEGAAEFDLLHGDERYKFLWAKQTHGIGRLEIYPPRPRGAIQRGTNELGRTIRRMARRILSRDLTGRFAAAFKSRPARGESPCFEIS